MPPILFLGKFSPLKVPGCALWCEADGGLTLIDDRVSAIADRSGNGRHFSSTYRALFSENGFNGRPCLNFDVNAVRYDGNSASLNLLASVPGFTLALIYWPSIADNSSSQSQVAITGNTAISVYKNATAYYQQMYGRRLATDGYSYAPTSSGLQNQPQIHFIRWDVASASIQCHKNASVIFNGAFGTAGNTDNTDATAIFIGHASGTLRGLWGGWMAWQRYITNTELEFLNYGYAHKYGITLSA